MIALMLDSSKLIAIFEQCAKDLHVREIRDKLLQSRNLGS